MILYNFNQTPNTGDRYASPHRYFKWLADVPVKWPWEWEPGKSIFGGGGMLHPGTDCWIEKAIKSGSPTVVWGIGLNYHGSAEQIYPGFLNEGGMIGLREKSNPWQFVPCPSCLAREFDQVSVDNPLHALVIYEHAVESIPAEVGKGFPRKTNQDGSDLLSVLQFLASGCMVLTNTFHGAYWSILLGKTPILYQPFSNRFLALGNLPVADFNTWRELVAQNETRKHFVTLKEARARNLWFSLRVRSYLDI